MTAITSIYIPHVNKIFDSQYIADIFAKNGIAQINRVAIEPYKSKGYDYNRVYVGIQFWHDTETAYNFIQRIKNPTKEAKIIYGDDNWWTVEVNNFPHKLEKGKKRELTIFCQPNFNYLIYQLYKDAEDFDSYLQEIDKERSLWYSQQSISDF